MSHQLSILAMLVSCGLWFGCNLKKKNSEVLNFRQEPAETADPATDGSRTYASFSADSDKVQKLVAPSLNNVAIEFPPGSLSVGGEISLDEGEDLAAGADLKDLGLSTDDIANAGTPVMATAEDKSTVLLRPMTLQLPIPPQSGLLQSSFRDLIAVIYRVFDSDSRTIVAGVLVAEDLRFGASTVAFDTHNWGIYQVVVTSKKIARVEAVESKAGIASKAGREFLPATEVTSSSSSVVASGTTTTTAPAQQPSSVGQSTAASVPSAPTNGTSSPSSPSNSQTPLIKGVISSNDATEVRLYLTADCSGSPLATGSEAMFESTGFAVSVPANASTRIYADAHGSSPIPSDCVTIMTYTHDDVGPAVTLYMPGGAIDDSNKANFGWSGTCTNGDGAVTVQIGGVTVSSACASNAFSVTTDLSLLDAGSYTVSASQTDAAGNTASDTKTVIKLANLSVAPRYSPHGDWMKFVQAGNPSATCQGDEPSIFACIHSGEKKKVEVPSESSCANLTLSDHLGAFDWYCEVVNGSVVFYSAGLKADKSLADLLDASQWKSNRVTLTKNAVTIGISELAVWWSNPVEVLTTAFPTISSAAVSTISKTAGTILTLSATVELHGIAVPNNEIAIVSLSPSAELQLDVNPSASCNSWYTGATCAIYSTGNFNWFEVAVNGSAASLGANDVGVLIESGGFNTVYRSQFVRLPVAVYLDAAHAARLARSSAISSGTTGLKITSGGFHVVADSQFIDSAGDGVYAFSTEENVFTRNMVVNSTNSGFYLYQATDSVFSQNLISNNQANGMSFNQGSSDNVVAFSTIVNSGTHGLLVDSSSGGANLSVVGTVAINNGANGFFVESTTAKLANIASGQNGAYQFNAPAGTMFSGKAIFDVSVGTSDCVYLSGLILADCTSPPGSTLTSSTVIFAGSAAFVGGSPIQSLAYGTLYGSANFQNDPALLLAWGKDNSNQIDVSARGRCGAANCGQWNWSLSAGSVLKGVLPQMNNGQACPAALNGATEYLTYALTREFLIAAIEIAEDRVGNDNGICESGESCIYARSIGVDQGSGSANQTCSYSGSANLAGITIYGY